LALCGLPWLLEAASEEFRTMPWNQPATVAKIYLATPGRTHWPKPTLDLGQEVAEIEARLGEVARMHAHHVRFTGGELIREPGQIGPFLQKVGDIDGLLIVPLSQPTGPLREVLDATPKVPAVFFSRPYATHAWSGIGAMQKAGRRIDVVASSSYGDLDPFLKAFRTAAHLKRSKVLVGDAKPDRRMQSASTFTERFGTRFQFYSGSEFKDAFRAADDRAARKEAEAVTKAALRVVEPSDKEILEAMRFYLAMKEMMKRESANAVTIDCFGTMAANTLPGYPCIAFAKLNDAGLYGVCEGDLASTMTQMLVTSYARVPGFVSDPVFDVSRNEVIHAHCVSATKMLGFDNPPSPYNLRNHLETDEGATIQVLMPSHETITVARFDGCSKLLISTAEVTGALDSDRGCRSQIRTRVSDAEKWLRNYSAGLHRVIFYGDHVKSIEMMGRLMNFQVIHEI
jgi:hypothetical protein